MTEDEFSIPEMLRYYISNTSNIFIYSLIPLLLGFSIVFFLYPISYSNQQIYSSNILIQERNVVNNISEDYFFSAKNLREAVNLSNLSDRIILNQDLISSFKITSGHSDLNLLINNYLESDLESLTQSLYFKPEEIENFIGNLISQGSRFRNITFDAEGTNLDKSHVNILLSNLILVINKNIAKDYDTTNINLKKISLLEVNSPLSSIDVNQINNRLLLLRDYINELQNRYSSYAPNINLKIDLINLESIEDLFNYVIQESKIHREVLNKQLNLDIDAVNKRIVVIRDKLNYIGNNSYYSDTGQNSSSPDASLTADASFIDSILDLGARADDQAQKLLYMGEITNLENNKISLERRLNDLELETNFEISLSEAKDYLINSLNTTSNHVNNYIEIVKNSKRNDAIIQLSSSNLVDEGALNKFIYQLLFILIGAILFGLAIVTIRFIR